MRDLIPRWLQQGWKRLINGPLTPVFVAGLLGGCYLLVVCHQFLSLFGTSLPAITALGLTLAVAVGFGSRDWRSGGQSSLSADRRCGLIHFALAGWMVVLPWLARLAVEANRLIPLERLAQPGIELLFLLAVSLLLALLPSFWVVQLPLLSSYRLQKGRRGTAPSETTEQRSVLQDVSGSRSMTERRASNDRQADSNRSENDLSSPPALLQAWQFHLAGVSVGLLAAAFVLSPLVGVQAVGWCAMGASCAFFLRSILQPASDSAGSPMLEHFEDSVMGSREDTSEKHSIGRQERWPTAAWLTIWMLCAGGMVTLLDRMLFSLVPTSSPFVVAKWGLFLGGVSLGFWFGARALRRGTDSQRLRGTASLVVAVATVGLLTAFPHLIHLSLTMNSHAWQVPLLMAYRGAVIALGMLPLGMACGMVVSALSRQRSAGKGFPGWGMPLTFFGGGVLARWLLLAGTDLAWLLVGLAWGTAVLAVVAEWPKFAFPRRRTWQVAWAAVAVWILAAPLWRHQYDSAKSAKLLFSTNVAYAHRMGASWNSLLHLDDGRLMDVVEGERGTYTLWKYRGVQQLLRMNGTPLSFFSTNTRLCPQPTSELLPIVVPLVLHEHPHDVLLLGMGGGARIPTALSFPVQQLTCVEGDPALASLWQNQIWDRQSEDPRTDDRLRLHTVEPILALSGPGVKYDVIVANTPQAAQFDATPYYTLEFYRKAASRLSKDGVFCQSFQQVDFGIDPLRNLAQTMRGAFQHLIAIETGTGEMLFVGTNSERGLLRGDLIERLQAEHVRRTLGEMGWDWPVLLNLTAYNNEILERIAESSSFNTASNGRFAFQLPPEVMRWGDKHGERQAALQEIQTAFAESGQAGGGRLLAWLGDDADDPVLLRRLAEVTGQQSLMTKYFDQPWAYRKTLRDQVKSRPRTLIRQVSAGLPKDGIHHEDRRRMGYLAALSAAVEHPRPELEAVARIARFESPYDPLVSYFLHQEVAELYARAQTRDVAAELFHRLHAIYFAHPGDGSVRNVADAILLLVEHPEAAPNAVERADHLNALLQTMNVRWDLRSNVSPDTAHGVLNDIDRSLTAVERALQAMDEITAEAGWSPEEWQQRRTHLEKTIVRPLRTYRSELLPHHYRQRKKTEHEEDVERTR